VGKSITHCKAIAKSTGKSCKRAPVKDGLCRYHLPREQQVEEQPSQNEKDQNKNPSLGKAFLNQQHTTREKIVLFELLLLVHDARRNKYRLVPS